MPPKNKKNNMQEEIESAVNLAFTTRSDRIPWMFGQIYSYRVTKMETKSITIRVDIETAQIYEYASEDERRKLDIMLKAA